MTEEAFAAARFRVLAEETSAGGIGTLSEKSLHRILKLTVDPDESHHEVPLAGLVADVYTPQRGVTEIQTRAFERLNKKLPVFLPLCPVEILYPVPREKYLRWVDPATCEMSPRRKSPRTNRPGVPCADVCRELYKIRRYLADPHLSVTLAYLDVEEFRLRCGWDKEGKRGSRRMERIPLALAQTVTLRGAESYRRFLLPSGLPEPFTVRAYAAATHMKPRWAYAAVRILCEVGVLAHTATAGREYLYAVCPPV